MTLFLSRAAGYAGRAKRQTAEKQKKARRRNTSVSEPLRSRKNLCCCFGMKCFVRGVRLTLVAKDCGRGGVSVKRLRVFFIDSVLRPQLPEQFSMTGL